MSQEIAGSLQETAKESTAADMPKRVRHYELIRELGRGGMGRVYLARDTRLGRRVAVKFIELASPAARERFILEARATAVCTHENIVVIHEVDSFQGQPYMVLEYVDGQPLSRLIETEPLAPARVVDLAVAILRGLKRAHELGIVHRDLKLDNVIVSRSGQVKLLDFGLAKPVAAVESDGSVATGPESEGSDELTVDGNIVGTPSYMAPEQFGFGEVDHRADFYALGILLHRVLTQQHPLPKMDLAGYWNEASLFDNPIPSLAVRAPHLPRALTELVDRCLAKNKLHRWANCDELLSALEAQRSESGRRIVDGECPFPGLTAFGETDAHRFFGRTNDVERIASRLRRRPLVVVAGPSGAGKSSVIRAGLIPALKNSGEGWSVLQLRPGRTPLRALAETIAGNGASAAAIEARLRTEPGYFGAELRAQAKDEGGKRLVFVDQFEELYTMTSDLESRVCFTTALAGAADDISSPIRVVVSMRSDFIDRVGEDGREFAEEFVRGITLLAAPNRNGLREALEQPLELTGYHFETPQTVEAMLSELANTQGPLPLLQFAATKLWSLRNESTRAIDHACYRAIGGVAGALAQHADEVLAGISGTTRKLCRELFVRLVTPERTRAIVQLSELRDLGGNPAEVIRLVGLLIDARLLVAQTRGGEDAAIEIVHESLVASWPTLTRWLDESHEDAAFLQQLRTVAKQWEDRGKPVRLLWTGETAEEALRWSRRNQGHVLTGTEKAFMDGVTARATRATRRRRAMLFGVVASLALVASAAVIAAIWIAQADRSATVQANLAKAEAIRARAAEQQAKEQLGVAAAREKERDNERAKVQKQEQELGLSRVELELANTRLATALAQATEEQAKARSAATRAKEAQERAEKLLEIERKRADRLQQARKKISTELR